MKTTIPLTVIVRNEAISRIRIFCNNSQQKTTIHNTCPAFRKHSGGKLQPSNLHFEERNNLTKSANSTTIHNKKQQFITPNPHFEERSNFTKSGQFTTIHNKKQHLSASRKHSGGKKQQITTTNRHFEERSNLTKSGQFTTIHNKNNTCPHPESIREGKNNNHPRKPASTPFIYKQLVPMEGF